jgi:hypothetical protein
MRPSSSAQFCTMTIGKSSLFSTLRTGAHRALRLRGKIAQRSLDLPMQTIVGCSFAQEVLRKSQEICPVKPPTYLFASKWAPPQVGLGQIH